MLLRCVHGEYIARQRKPKTKSSNVLLLFPLLLHSRFIVLFISFHDSFIRPFVGRHWWHWRSIGWPTAGNYCRSSSLTPVMCVRLFACLHMYDVRVWCGCVFWWEQWDRATHRAQHELNNNKRIEIESVEKITITYPTKLGTSSDPLSCGSIDLYFLWRQRGNTMYAWKHLCVCMWDCFWAHLYLAASAVYLLHHQSIQRRWWIIIFLFSVCLHFWLLLSVHSIFTHFLSLSPSSFFVGGKYKCKCWPRAYACARKLDCIVWATCIAEKVWDREKEQNTRDWSNKQNWIGVSSNIQLLFLHLVAVRFPYWWNTDWQAEENQSQTNKKKLNLCIFSFLYFIINSIAVSGRRTQMTPTRLFNHIFSLFWINLLFVFIFTTIKCESIQYSTLSFALPTLTLTSFVDEHTNSIR